MKIEIPDGDVKKLVSDLRAAAYGIKFFPASRDRLLELADYIEKTTKENS